MESYLTE
jgi:hypothetical protein